MLIFVVLYYIQYSACSSFEKLLEAGTSSFLVPAAQKAVSMRAVGVCGVKRC